MGRALLALRRMAVAVLRSQPALLAALAVAGLTTAALLVAHGAEASLHVATELLGADIVVVPVGAEAAVANGLLFGTPVLARMPADTPERIAAIPGVAAASPALLLSCPMRGAECTVPGMFLVAYDPATDFSLRPFLGRSLPGGPTPGGAVGGSALVLPPGEEAILVYGCPLRLVGSLPPTGTNLDQSLFFTFETAHRVASDSFLSSAWPPPVPLTHISMVTVRVRVGSDAQAVAAEVRRRVPWAAPVSSADLFARFRQRARTLRQGIRLPLALAGLLLGAFVVLPRRIPAEAHPNERALSALAGGGLGVALGCVAATLGGGPIAAHLGLPFLPPPLPLRLLLAGCGAAVALAAARFAAPRQAMPPASSTPFASDG